MVLDTKIERSIACNSRFGFGSSLVVPVVLVLRPITLVYTGQLPAHTPNGVEVTVTETSVKLRAGLRVGPFGDPYH